MALTAEDIRDIEERLKPGSGISDEERTALLEAKQEYENANIGGWAAAGPSPVANKTPAPGKLGVTGIIGQDAPEDPEQAALGAVAATLDPRFDLVPQALALQPATTHPGGDKAAEQSWRAGDKGDVTFAYEPPVGMVRKQLLENPSFLRMLRPSAPPTIEEINGLDSSSPLYKDAANYMWGETAKKAIENGRTVIRYSQAPYLGESIGATLSNLKTQVQGAGHPVKDAVGAFVLGMDNTAAFGAGRAAMETLDRKTQMSVPGGGDVMGLNEGAEHQTKDLVNYGLEDNPVSYGAGQVAGAFAPWSIANRTLDMLKAGGGELAALAARYRAGRAMGALAEKAPAALKTGGAIAADTATGVVDAAMTEAGQQGVSMGAETLQTGEQPTAGRFAEAAERVKDVGGDAVKWAGGGALATRGAGAAANYIRNADRLGGAVGRTEPNMNWGISSVITGPRLSGETKTLVKQARKERHMPGDYIAEQIQPKMQEVANQRATSIESSNLAKREQVYGTAEGRATLPVTNLQQAAVKEIRAHHQPTDGKPHAVNEKSRPAIKAFNTHIADVTTEPVEGAIKLAPSEVDTFLNPHWRHRLWQRESDGAAAAREGKPPERVDRDSYVRVAGKDARGRTALDEEIEDEIEERLQDRGGAAADAKRGDKAYDEIEQEVLAERVEEEAFEETTGSIGDWLRQQGKEAVYVVPYRYDAERTEKLIQGLPDGDLRKAALKDREARPLEGKAGGWARTRESQDQALGKARDDAAKPTFENVAKHQTMRPADKQEADLFRGLADQAGVRGELDRLRSVNEAVGVQRQAWGRGMEGEKRSFFSPQNAYDTALLRAFPFLRQLEPMGALGEGRLGRAALVGQQDEEAQRFAGESSARAKYVQARERRMKEIAAEKEKGRAERKRKWSEDYRD